MLDARKLVVTALWLVMALLLSGGAYAGVEADEIRDVVMRLGASAMADPGLPGMSVAVLKKGQNNPVRVAFGTACVENEVPMTPEQRIKIGSVTKVFTAVMIEKLIAEGRLGYDTTIDRFFPDFPGGENITVRHLLNHTSGIVDMLSLPAVQANMTKAWNPVELIALAGAAQPLFAPGAKQQYSNTGYLMLAVISEIVSGRTYEDQIRDLFRDRLGMTTLAVGRDEAIVPPMSCGYSASANGTLTLPIMAGLAMAKGTGDLVATPGDVVRLVNLDRVVADNFLKTAPLVPMRLPDGTESRIPCRNTDCGYSRSFLDGCTLFLFDDGMALLGKLGSFPGFGTAFFYDRQSEYAVCVSVNNERSVARAIRLGADILRALRR